MLKIANKYIILFFIFMCQYSYSFTSSLSPEDKIKKIVFIDKNTIEKDLIDIIIPFKGNKIISIDNFIYGYVNIYLANIYNERREYSKASEAIKKAFYYIDKSVEVDITNWRSRYLRLRVDAFVPEYLGRCEISLLDSDYLLANKEIDKKLKYIIKYMHAKSLKNCKKNTESTIIINELLKTNDDNEIISNHGINNNIPWFPIEINLVISYLVSEKKYGF
ncbi:hypothetical protein ACISK3_12770 [Morganella morganii]|nr:hypothetical protein [Morganella morganii]